MTARSLHEVATRTVRKVHRTGQPVRRNSYKVGARESRFWTPFDRREFNARMRAAEDHDRKNKQPGKRNGPIGHVGLEVYRELMRRIGWKDGRLEPSIATICGWLNRSVDAVTKALARLKAEGFLDWIRRFEPVENPDPFGPQVKQATNAYRLTLPKAAAEFVRRLMRKPTEAQRDAAELRDREARAHRAMTEHEQAEAVAAAMCDPTSLLGRSLRSFGAAFDAKNAILSGGENPALQG